MMKKFFGILLTLAMVLSLAACGGGNDKPADSSTPPADSSQPSADAPSGSAGGTFKLGGVGPLTGDAAIYGNAAMNGAQIAVDEINALGGIQLEFKAEDDVADGETSVNAYNTLMDWGMQVLVGPVTTGAAIAVSAEIYNDRVFALTDRKSTRLNSSH